MVEWRGLRGAYALEAAAAGTKAWVARPPGAAKGWCALLPEGAREWPAAGAPERPWGWVCSSLTADPEGKELAYLAEFAARLGAEAILADHPTQARLDVGRGLLAKHGYHVAQLEVVTSRYGDRSARRRGVLLAASEGPAGSQHCRSS